MSDNIIGQPSYEFYNLLPSQCEGAAKELADVVLGDNSACRIELIEPEGKKFYYVISERGEDGKYVETSRDPAKWAAGLAVAGAWGQERPQHERPNTFDIESMGAHFELIALKNLIAQKAEEGVQV